LSTLWIEPIKQHTVYLRRTCEVFYNLCENGVLCVVLKE